MAKDENVMQTLLKLSKKGNSTDAFLYDVLSKCDNKTELIKNALFNYIVNIQNGIIIDRAYPYNKVEKYTEIEKEKIIYSHNYGYGYNNFNTENKHNNSMHNEDDYDNEEIENEDYTTDEDDYYGESKYEDSNVSLF